MVINPQTKDEKLQYILIDSGARILFTDISVMNISGTLNEVETIQEVIFSLKDDNIHDRIKFRINSFDQIFSSKQFLVPYPVIMLCSNISMISIKSYSIHLFSSGWKDLV